MWLYLQLSSVIFWASINILDSGLVHRYKMHPMALNWNQSYFSVPLLLLFSLVVDVHSAWALPLFVVGMIAYAGDQVFFISLRHVDVSVTNIAWFLLSIFLCLGGFLLFQERWTAPQTAGVLLISLGILFVSLWHRRTADVRYLSLLPLLALLYTPFYLVQKMALVDGSSVAAVVFWAVIGREGTSVCLPLLIPSVRPQALRAARVGDRAFFAANAVVIVLFFAATAFTTYAFQSGPVSLVGVVGNVQPFVVLLCAWLFQRLLPGFAPKERTDARAILVKSAAFLVAFTGLALLAASA